MLGNDTAHLFILEHRVAGPYSIAALEEASEQQHDSVTISATTWTRLCLNRLSAQLRAVLTVGIPRRVATDGDHAPPSLTVARAAMCRQNMAAASCAAC